MPDVDLSTLSGPELRTLLDTCRARGQAAVSYQILQEMAARRDKRPAIPRRVTLDLGDPLVRDDEAFTPAPPVEAEADDDAPLYLVGEPRETGRPPKRRRKGASPPPAEAPEPPQPRSVWDVVPEPALKLEGLPGPDRKAGRRPALVFAAGIALGVAGGWAAAGLDLGRQAPPPAAAPTPEFLQVAKMEPPPLPVAPPPAPPVAEPEVVAPEVVAEEVPPEAEAPEVEVAEVEATPAPIPAPAPPKPVVQKAKDEATPNAACAAEKTPADRTICADPQLRKLQKELRAAYGEALEAHEARDVLRKRQLAWRDARNTVEDPAQLARLYEARIRRLHAAAEAARER